MRTNLTAIAMVSAALAACSPEQASAPSTPVADEPTAAASTDPAALGTVYEPPAMGKRAAGDVTPPLTVFRAFGNEPFWNVNVEDNRLTFTTPDDQVGVVMQGERRTLANGVEFAGSHEGKSFSVRVITGICSDGMSDNQHSLVSNFRYGDANYKGCGEAAK